ncbi:MAG: alpha-1,2-fucosyltransferase [Smithella sp.]|jgi:hypothetical protein
MNIIQIWGGLGNQMFQYAFAKGLVYKTGEPFSVDLSFFDTQDPLHRCCVRTYELERVFGLKFPVAEKDVIRQLQKKSPFNWLVGRNLKIHAINPWRRDRDEKFHPEMWNPIRPKGTGVYYKGYWQHEQYFEFIADEVRLDFTFKPLTSRYSQGLLQQIKDSSSISLHVRRTDFVGSQNETSFDYYLEAIRKIIEQQVLMNTRPHLFIFSDDIEWVKNNFRADLPVTCVDQTTDPAEDMCLMSQCQHNILAPKSSFSWWAAWLNRNPQKIVI